MGDLAEPSFQDDTEAILRGCGDGVCCGEKDKDGREKERDGGESSSGSTGRKREGGDCHTATTATVGRVRHEEEAESETVAPGNKRALSQDENDIRQ